MQKTNKKQSKKDEPLFTEEERNNIPFVRTVSNKMRNITKKLADIAELEAKDIESLKPEQKEKISKRQQLQDEIAKYEEVLKLYKAVESERKDNEAVSDADRVVQLLAVFSAWSDNRSDLEAKGVVSKEETEQLSRLFEGSQKVRNMKQRLTFLNGISRQLLKNQPSMDLIQKITGHPQFQNLQCTQMEQTKKETPAESKKTEQVTVTQEATVEAKPTSTEVVGAPPVLLISSYYKNLEPQEPKKEIQEPTANTADNKQPEKQPQTEATKESQKEPVKEENAGQSTQHKRETDRPRQQYRERGEKQWPGHGGNANQVQKTGSFTREERAQLDKDGFTIVEKPKVVSKVSTKQFGPRRDNRQYHQ